MITRMQQPRAMDFLPRDRGIGGMEAAGSRHRRVLDRLVPCAGRPDGAAEALPAATSATRMLASTPARMNPGRSRARCKTSLGAACAPSQDPAITAHPQLVGTDSAGLRRRIRLACRPPQRGRPTSAGIHEPLARVFAMAHKVLLFAAFSAASVRWKGAGAGEAGRRLGIPFGLGEGRSRGSARVLSPFPWEARCSQEAADHRIECEIINRLVHEASGAHRVPPAEQQGGSMSTGPANVQRPQCSHRSPLCCSRSRLPRPRSPAKRRRASRSRAARRASCRAAPREPQQPPPQSISTWLLR